MRTAVLLAAAVAVLAASSATAAKQPHILFIVADDLGWDDVGFRSHQINTPTIDGLAASGIILNDYHVQSVCSPSRATFLSGAFPQNTGIEDWIPPASSYGLPLNFTTMADLMTGAGYASHAVGKWHLGFYKWAYTPTFRGFQSFRGFYSGGEDYFKHTSGKHYDFRRDPTPRCGEGCSQVDVSANGRYSTEVFAEEAVSIVNAHDPSKQSLFLYLAFQAVHAPSEVPGYDEDPYASGPDKINDMHRRVFAGMLSSMDSGIGNVTAALKAKGMLEDTVIVFTADNGGPMPDTPGGDYVGSRNWPLRGGKHSIWEGGTRATGVISGAGLESQAGTTSNAMLHAADWLPTFSTVAGYDVSGLKHIDGIDQWDVLANGAAPQRTEFLYGRHDDAPNSTTDNALRQGDWKLILGTGGKPNTWTPPVNVSAYVAPEALTTAAPDLSMLPPVDAEVAALSAATAGASNGTYLLFNLTADPSERSDLSGAYPEVVEAMAVRLLAILQTGVPAASNDPTCGPATYPKHTDVGTVLAPWC